jgi:hypothetical protein
MNWHILYTNQICVLRTYEARGGEYEVDELVH